MKIITMATQDTATSRTFDERWTDMYHRLVAFKDEEGHCLVPNRYPKDKKLGAWVSAQRRHYKILTSGSKESTPMTMERAQKLIDLGFDWSTTDPRHVSWEDRYEQLKDFNATYGHTKVPMNWSENSSLSNWVSSQRQDYKLFQKGSPSHLTQEKINLLNDIGFVWEAQRGGRRRKLQALSEAQKSPSEDSKPERATIPTTRDALSLQRAASSDKPASLPRYSSSYPRSEGAFTTAAALGASLDTHKVWSPGSFRRNPRQDFEIERQQLLLSSLQGAHPIHQHVAPAIRMPTVTNTSLLAGLSDTEKALLRNRIAPAPPNTDLIRHLRGQLLADEHRTASAIASLVAREQQMQRQASNIGPIAGICHPRPTTLMAAATGTASRNQPEMLNSMLARSALGNQIAGLAGLQPAALLSTSQLALESSTLAALRQRQQLLASSFSPTASTSFFPIGEERKQSSPTIHSGRPEDSRKRARREL